MAADSTALPQAETFQRYETGWKRLNAVFQELGDDHQSNISRLSLVALEILGADAALYSNLDGETLQRRWSRSIVFPGIQEIPAAGTICFNAIISADHGECVVVDHLPQSAFTESDPAVASGSFQTYFGHSIGLSRSQRGAFAVLYDERRSPDEVDRQMLTLICQLISSEQDRDDSRQEVLLGEEKFGAFFRSSLDGVLIHDLAGRVIDANPSAERMFGYPYSWLVRMNLTRLVPVESARTARNALREVKATGYSRMEIVLKRMDGTLFPAEIVGSRFEFDGEPRVHGIIRDISQRKQAQDEAAERHLRFRAVFEQSLDGIMLHDEQGKVVEANGRMCQLLGCAKEDLIGISLSQLHADQDQEERQRYFHEVQTSGASRYECELRRRDGSCFSAEVAASSFTLAGKTFVQEIVRDVTARREAEAEIRRAKEEAERANEAKSVFLATMSHEIRTPLNGILGFARLLEEGHLDEAQQQHLGMVKTSGNILLALINDILDFSRIESGKIELEEVAFDPSRLLSDTLALHAPAAAEKDLRISQKVVEAVPPIVRGDPARLRQVLMNLIGNAVKFTEQGSIKVRLTVDGDHRLMFSVVDTGPGFTEAQQAQLFQPFYQTDLSATRKHGGTGLGLAICRRLMQAMGGGIEALRRERGAEFRFWIPLVEGVDSKLRRIIAPRVGCRPVRPGLRLLVAEDQPINARLICLLLERIGIAAEVVSDGPLVFDRLKMSSELPDAVLLDMRMPGMDGVEVARRIRAGEAGEEASKLTLIAVTANALESDRRACFEAGMDKHLAKPVTPEALERVLQEVGLLEPMADSSSPG